MNGSRLSTLQRAGEELMPVHSVAFHLVPQLYGSPGRSFRKVFDQALEELHYAGSCQRVGRCMRLAIVDGQRWLGGIVLGSTFPNVDCRDVALNFKRFVRGDHVANLRSPWARENRAYWERLQSVVNHARTFVFPEYQGKGIGVAAHELLLTEGVACWLDRYPGPVIALDTLCDSRDSGLFLRNAWIHVGVTRGFGSDSRTRLAQDDGDHQLRNNVGLKPTNRQWEVWVRPLGVPAK